jgi:hypothetical protein
LDVGVLIGNWRSIMTDHPLDMPFMHLFAKAMDLLEMKSEKIILLTIEVEKLKQKVNELDDYIKWMEE